MKRALLYLIADEDAKRFARLFLHILGIGIACVALLFAWRSILFLRLAPVFKPYFAPTCLVARDEDVLPAALNLMVALSVALVSSAAVLIYSPVTRRISLRLLIVSLTFAIGMIAAGAI